MKSVSFSVTRPLLLAGLLAWLTPRATRAENSLAYKFEDYREADGRIAVRTQGAFLEQSLGTEMHLKLSGLLDTITGATPTGEPAPAGSDQVGTSLLHQERRKAWSADLSRQFGRYNLALGGANSRESDYVSNGWSMNLLTDFNQKNTTLLLGYAGTDDKIKIFYNTRLPRHHKHTNDAIVGLTQLLDPRTSVTLNLTWGRAAGFLSDPYKLVQKNTQIFPGVFLPLTFGENRPQYREKWVAFAGYNRTFPDQRGALEASYRFYTDTFDVDAHTLDLAWFQRVGEKFILRPGVRIYEQRAARFYVYNLNNSPLTPVSSTPRPDGPFYSSDFRLSEMRTFTYGLKGIWNVTDTFALDLALEQYDMHGLDGLTPRSAYANARIVTAGVKYTW
ncbi:MAG: DUF3570 domain-containing protein [Verrucomicrobia bacterium]|nr:DUF3570 domain-containing protein [Verrucomicrobiota bacterium]